MTLTESAHEGDAGWERTCRFLGWDRAVVESTVLALRETPLLSSTTLQVEAFSSRMPHRDGPFQVKAVAMLLVTLRVHTEAVFVSSERVFSEAGGHEGFRRLLGDFAESLAGGAEARERGAAKLSQELRPPILRIAERMRAAAATVRERAETIPA